MPRQPPERSPSPASGVRRRARIRARVHSAGPRWSNAARTPWLCRGRGGGRRLRRAIAPGGRARSCVCLPFGASLFGEDGEEVADLLLARDGVRQRQVRLDRVVVAPAVALAGEVSRRLELRDDAVGGALRDAD